MSEDPEDNEGRGLWVGPIILAGLILCLVLVASCAMAETVRDDRGGSVAERIEHMRNMSQPVRIEGYCASACTLYLGLPAVCVAPSARLGFHGPSTRLGLPLPREEWESVSQTMARHYPPLVRLWFLGKARYQTGTVTILRGAQLIAMGVPRCTA